MIAWLKKKFMRADIVVTNAPPRDPALATLFGTRPNFSGVAVDEYSALTASAYYSGVNLISSTFGMIGITLVKQTEKGIKEVKEHPVNRMLKFHTNDYTSPYQFQESLIHDAIAWGNSYWQIVDVDNEDISLWRLPPDRVTIKWDKEGNKTYVYRGMPGGKTLELPPEEVLHLTGFGYDPCTGLGKSVVQLAKESIGLSIATERYGEAFFGNNATPGGIITHPLELDPTAKANIESEVEDRTGNGPHRSRRIVVLDEGMKYIPVSFPPEDGQFLQTRQFQVREMARWLRVPPHMLYDSDESTNGNMEVQDLGFLKYTLSPWIIRLRHELRRKLLAPALYEVYDFHFDTDRLLMLDTVNRYNAYNTARNLGMMSLNDINRKENLPLLPSEIGDTHIVPSTMRILEPNDPRTPVDPVVMQNTVAFLQSLGKPPPEVIAVVINATMPTVDEKFIKLLTNVIKDLPEKQDGDTNEEPSGNDGKVRDSDE